MVRRCINVGDGERKVAAGGRKGSGEGVVARENGMEGEQGVLGGEYPDPGPRGRDELEGVKAWGEEGEG